VGAVSSNLSQQVRTPPPRATQLSFNRDQGTMNQREQDRISMWDLQHARRLIAIVWRAFSLAVFLAGIGFAGYAGVQWLQTAHWQPLTVNGVVTSWPTTRDWVAHPRAWLGLHRVIMWVRSVPVFVIVTLLGGALLVLSPPLTRSPTWQDAW
jgi:hypothetical protein